MSPSQNLLSQLCIAEYLVTIILIKSVRCGMAEYRTHMKIIGDILTTTRDDIADDSGASVTYLIRKANISHVRISRILNNLVSQGLLEQNISKNYCKYRISQNGREFLSAYQSFSKFAENFGLAI